MKNLASLQCCSKKVIVWTATGMSHRRAASASKVCSQCLNIISGTSIELEKWCLMYLLRKYVSESER